jgi:hypothetical protein
MAFATQRIRVRRRNAEAESTCNLVNIGIKGWGNFSDACFAGVAGSRFVCISIGADSISPQALDLLC